LAAAKKHGVKKLCFASSAAVYGENPVQPKVETMTPDPRSPYGITKLDGEYYCSLYNREGWLETAALRFFNVFGTRQDPSGAYAAAVPIFIQKALAGQPITIFGDGGQTRDFIYVKDVVDVIIFMMEHPTVNGIFNVGTGKACTWNELAYALFSAAGKPVSIEYMEMPESLRPRYQYFTQADMCKLSAAGYKRPFTSLNDAIADYCKFLKNKSYL
ncbi:MAG: NAD-dependent epimerase/dehydratase family protein, partial [Candidatus Omnitrophota bacterium]